MDNINEKYLSLENCSRISGKSTMTFRRLCKKNKCEYTQVKEKYYILRTSLMSIYPQYKEQILNFSKDKNNNVIQNSVTQKTNIDTQKYFDAMSDRIKYLESNNDNNIKLLREKNEVEIKMKEDFSKEKEKIKNDYLNNMKKVKLIGKIQIIIILIMLFVFFVFLLINQKIITVNIF